MTNRKPAQSNNKRKPRRGQTDTSRLKVSLVVGSILATLVAGEMLAHQDAIVAAEPINAPIVVQQSNGLEGIIGNDPIVELVIPEPVTRSRSSG